MAGAVTSLLAVTGFKMKAFLIVRESVKPHRTGYQAGKLKLGQTGLIQTVFLRLIIHKNYLNTLFALQNLMMSLF